LNTVNAQDIANAKTTLQKVNEYTNNVLEKVDSPVLSTQKLKVKEHKKMSWMVIFGNLFIIGIGALAFMYFNRKMKEKKKIDLEKRNKASQPIVNIAETEAMLRSKSTFDLQSHLDYLNRTVDEEKTKFFDGVEKLRADADEYCRARFNSDFSQYLKTNFGMSDDEKYKHLMTQVAVEKYSPYSSAAKRSEILTEIKEVYNKI